MPKCDALDNEFKCSGEVKQYRVINEGGFPHNWGKFYYCEAHARDDRDRGFTLTECEEEDHGE